MQYCEKCKASIRGRREYCPLCQGPLTGEGSEEREAFPLMSAPRHPYHLFFRIMVFLSVASVVVCLAINAMFPGSGKWSLFVAAGMGCMWLSLIIAVQKRGNIPKNIIWQAAVVSVLCVLWDWFTGRHGWSIDYVLPILFVFAMMTMAVIARILRLKIEDYLIYLVIDALYGIIPVAFWLLGWLKVVYPSLICAAVSLVSLTALLAFEGENMREEIKKRLHL